MKNTLAGSAVLAAAVIVLTGCGGDSTTDAATNQADPDASEAASIPDLGPNMPNLVGVSLPEAEELLDEIGLEYHSLPEEPAETYSQEQVDDLIVYETRPESGNSTLEGEIVSICVAPRGEALEADDCFMDPSEVEPPGEAEAEDCPDGQSDLPDEAEPAGWPQDWEEGEPLPETACHPDFIPLETWEHSDSQCMDPVAHGTLLTDEELAEMGEEPMDPDARLEAEWEASQLRASWSPPAEGEDCYGYQG